MLLNCSNGIVQLSNLFQIMFNFQSFYMNLNNNKQRNYLPFTAYPFLKNVALHMIIHWILVY